jgi:S-methyl-5-thioribose-1-phosphate isomerase
MHVNDKQYRTIWMEGTSVFMIDQTKLPFQFEIFEAKTYRDTCKAIKTMITRGAGAIGAAAGFAMAQAYLEGEKTKKSELGIIAKEEIEATRPTAGNLFYAVNKVFEAGFKSAQTAVDEAQRLADENIDAARKIGEFGNDLIEDGFRIATHCNAGWLGFVDYGSALSPIYTANESGKKLYVYADETRPRAQGARLTAWELKNENIAHAIIPDNALAYYMSKGEVDMMIVGADRIAANGDVANKIGTLEKAIIAEIYDVPFYVAAPLSTFDMNSPTGEDIVIEKRAEEEVTMMEGPDEKGIMHKIRVANPGSPALNPAFDVTPAELIKGIITEKGIIIPDTETITQLFELG